MKKLSQWPWKNIGIIVLVLVVIALLFQPLSSVTQMVRESLPMDFMAKNRVEGFSTSSPVAMEQMAFDGDSAKRSILPPQPGETGISPEVEQRQLIRTGDVSLIVADVEESIASIKQKTTDEWNGIVADANLNNRDDDSQSGWMRIRIPGEKFEVVMLELKAMALKVESENSRIDDVTSQVQDTETRLRNLRVEEEQYLSILQKAETVEETLQATDYLNRVRNEIEWAEASLKNITEQVALSTININLIDEGDVEVLGFYWTPWLNVKKSAREAMENLTASVDAVITFALNIPLILIWIVLIILAGKLGWKGLKKIGLV